MGMAISSFVCAGIWLALPVTGCAIALTLPSLKGKDAIPPLGKLGMVTIIGMIPWSAAMLEAAILGLYRPYVFGGLGWLVFLIGLFKGEVRKQCRELFSWGASDFCLGLGLCVLALVYLLFPADCTLGGRDMGTYTNHAIFIAQQGRLDVPYPWMPHEHSLLYPAMKQMPGFYKTPDMMTVQFGHLYPLWLAQAFGTAGAEGIGRFNGILALLGLALFYSIAARLVPVRYALVAALFLGLNPSEVWLARTSLSEVFAQVFIWASFWCLVRALQTEEKPLAHMAAILLGCAVLVRIDSLLIVACLLTCQTAHVLIYTKKKNDIQGVWMSYLGIAIPTLGIAVGYYARWSTPYFFALKPELLSIGLLVLAMTVILCCFLVLPASFKEAAYSFLSGRSAFAILAGGVILLLVYGLFIRPDIEPYSLIERPGHPLHGTRDFREDSLVNIAKYISIPALVAAVFGWLLMMRRSVRSELWAPWLVPLIVLGGIAAVYLWKPSIFPDHFWAIRRFVPVVIPGLILFAAVGFYELIGVLPIRALWETGVAVFFLVFAMVAYWPFWSFVEHKDVYLEMKHFATQLPKDRLLFAQGSSGAMRWIIPLAVAFDRKIVPLNLDTKAGQDVLAQWFSEAGDDFSVYVLSETSIEIPNFTSFEVQKLVYFDQAIQAILKPLPTRVLRSSTRVSLFRLHKR